jgi:hypothetical protein
MPDHWITLTNLLKMWQKYNYNEIMPTKNDSNKVTHDPSASSMFW